MRTKLVTRLVPLMALVGYCGGAMAQPGGLPDSPPRDAVFFRAAPVLPFMGGPIDILGASGNVPGAVVENKPYTADSITESTQVLLDGNRIVTRNEARVARDSAGRTRLEQTLRGMGGAVTAREPVTLTTINDPVAGSSYVLDPQARMAREVRPLTLALDASFAPESGGPELRRVETGVTPVAVGERVAVRGGAMRAAPGILQFRVAASPESVEMDSRTEDLGEQVLEGLLTRGTRTTQTIPAGALGNERAIEISTEQWYASDIEAVVLRRSMDPRFGEVVYRLVNVVQGEPAATLFSVPTGYEVADPAQPFEPNGGRFERQILVTPASGR